MKEIKKPAFMQEAATSPGHPWIVEILICMVIYMAGMFAASFGQLPGIMTYLLQNGEYIRMLRTGEVDMELLSRLIQNMPEWFTIFTLFTEVFFIFVYMFYCRFVEHRKISTMGFCGNDVVRQYIKGLLIGIGAFGAAYLLCLVTGSVKFDGTAADVIPAYILLYFGGYMIQGMAEEIVCRGFLMVSLSRKYTVWFSAAMSSLLFLSLHFANDGMTLLSMINLFLFGMFLALLFVESGNIWVVAAMHSVWNFLQGNIFGVQVSGLAKQNSVFDTTFVEGHGAIHGGSFGMEGGLAVTVVLFVGIRLIYGRMQKKDMLEEVSQTFSDHTGETYGTANTSEAGDSDERVYLRNPSEFTETPWRPDLQHSSIDSIQNVFNADYFKTEEK